MQPALMNKQLNVLKDLDTREFTDKGKTIQALLILSRCGSNAPGNVTSAKLFGEVVTGPLQKMMIQWDSEANEAGLKTLLRSASTLSYKGEGAVLSCTTTMKAIAEFNAWPYSDLTGRDACITYLELGEDENFAQPAPKKRNTSDNQHDVHDHEPTEKMLRAASSSVDAMVKTHQDIVTLVPDEINAAARAHSSSALMRLTNLAEKFAREIHQEAFEYIDSKRAVVAEEAS